MKIPDDKHPIRIKPHDGTVRVSLHGEKVAQTDEALDLFESDYPPVTYIPREAVEQSLLVPSNHTTRCPYKGEASYFSLETRNQRVANAAWTYAEPNAAVDEIRGYLAFYPDKVEISG